jgi:hypothetical protein
MSKALRVPKWACIAGLVGLLVVWTGLLIVTLISQAAKKLFLDNRDISFDVRGDLIVFTGKGNGGTDLYMYDLSTQKVRRLTNSPWLEKNPRFTPDGNAVLFEARREASNPKGSWNLFTITLRDRKLKQLTQGGRSADLFVSFLPDKSTILAARTSRLTTYSMGGYVWDWYAASYYTVDLSRQRLQNFPVRWGDWYIFGFSPSGEHALAARPISHAAVGKEPEIWLLEARPLLQQGQIKGRKVAEGTEAVLLPALNQIAIVAPSGSPYWREIWTVELGSGRKSQRTSFRGRIECLRADTKNNHVYFLLLEDGASMTYSLWRLHLPSGRLEKVADADLFSDPLGNSKRAKGDR